MESQDNMIEMDMRQLFFNNLLLLGLDTVSLEAENHIPFNKSMFNLPNKKGAEIILHFLFQRLNPTLCADMFRNCWPVLDKKKEQEFRKTCHNWLSGIAQEEAECHLPRINASLFMSPGGDKFYQLLFYFSGYVLQKVLNSELGSKSVEQLKYPKLCSQNLSLAEVIQKDLTCSSIRHRQQYFDTLQLTIKARKTWKKAADGYVREYRKLSKEVRELDYRMRAEQQRAAEAAQARGSPMKRKGGVDDLDPDFDPRTIKRAQRIQQVRDMWKQLDGFELSLASEREIVASIVERTVNKYVLDAADISVKVPDMLLRECEAEIRRRNVDNTYQGGQLNLVSVLQLWNLSLHLYLEKLNKVGVPKFDEEVKKLTSQVHVQQTYHHNTQSLRHQMEEGIPLLKENIENLRDRLDSEFFKEATPTAIRATSVGLSLIDPSPEAHFSPRGGNTPVSLNMNASKGDESLVTPEAANRITKEVLTSVRQAPKQLFSIDQLSSKDARQQTKDSKQQSKDSKQQKVSSIPSSRHSSRPTSAHSTTSSRVDKKTSNKSSPRSARSGKNTKREEEEFPPASSPRTMMQTLNTSHQSTRSDRSITSEKTLTPKSARSEGSEELQLNKGQGDFVSRSAKVKQGSDKVIHSPLMSSGSRGYDDILSPRSDRMVQGRRTPTDYLVAEILGEEKIPSPFNSGLDAFEKREIVRRTPDLEDITSSPDSTPITRNILSGQPASHGDQYEDYYITATAGDEDEFQQGLQETGDDGDADEIDDRDNGDDNADEDKENQAPQNVRQDQSVEIEDVLGPELEGEYDNDDNEVLDNLSDTSQRSQEQIIVIDRSIIHQSPKQSPKLAKPVAETFPLEAYNDDVDLLDEEEFPGFEDSPQHSIIIDRSFNQASRRPKDGPQMSASFQGQPSEMYKDNSKDIMTRSLVFDKSPLSDEIRRMFKEALSDSTPKKPELRSRALTGGISSVPILGAGGSSGSERDDKMGRSLLDKLDDDNDTVEHVIHGGSLSKFTRNISHVSSELELPNMDLDSRTSDRDLQPSVYHSSRAHKSDLGQWEDPVDVENIADIQMPDFDTDHLLAQAEMDHGLGDDLVPSDLDPDYLEGFLHSSKSPKRSVLSPKRSPRADTSDKDLDDFFSSKTPEMPKLRTLKGLGGSGSPVLEKSKVTLDSDQKGEDLSQETFNPPRLHDDILISFTP